MRILPSHIRCARRGSASEKGMNPNTLIERLTAIDLTERDVLRARKYPKVIERTATMRADTDIVAIIRLTFEWI